MSSILDMVLMQQSRMPHHRNYMSNMALLDSDMGLVADRARHLNLNRYTDLASHRVADLPGNWSRGLLGNLVALPLGFGLALRTSGVMGNSSIVGSISIGISFSISFPLAIAVAIVAIVVSLLLILVPVLPQLPDVLVEVLLALLLLLVVVLPALSLLLPEVLDVLPLSLVVIVIFTRAGRPLAKGMTMSSNSNTMTMGMDGAAMANNSRAAMHLLGDLLAHLGHHVLAILHMCGLHHCVYFCATHLISLCVASCV